MNAITEWLESLGLAEHAPAFVAQGIEPELLSQLDDADLRSLGVARLGDRKRLRMAIDARARADEGAAATPVPLAARAAERRQLTVMFCDLVGSTQLAARLDPEDLQGLIRSYHDAVAGAVRPYEGHVAQLLGDGCLVYFGYPRAHEDDAARALHAALNVLQAVARLVAKDGTPLVTRIGIATGRVVVGEIGTGTPAVERTASGETPNLAARLQAHAAPGEIIVAAETRRLAGASFEFEATEALQLKGFDAPVVAWRVRGERRPASRFEAQHDSELVQFVGRGSEVALLLERWALACEGEGQVVLLSGEAGIGKSRICQTLRERLAGQRHATVLLQCSPYHSGSPLYPLVRSLERTAGITSVDTPAQRGLKLERLMVPEMEMPAASRSALLRLMGATPGEPLPQATDPPEPEMARTLQAPIDLLRGLARQLPVLLLIEDAHWIDPTTEQLGALTAGFAQESRLLMLVTARPEYAPAWGSPPNLTRLALNRLGQRQCAELIQAVAGGRPVPAEIEAEILRKTDGIPLFVEELTKTVLQSGLLEDTAQGYRLRGPLPALAIPSTLQDSLMARLDRLAPAKEVAQVGAMIGREFSQRLLAAVLEMAPDRLDDALDELVRRELVTRRGSGADALYTFRHALIRDTAYQSVLKAQRALRHGQIAAAIERVEPDTLAVRPELLAYHRQQAAQVEEAYGHWVAAGKRAVERAAHREAVAHYRSALALLPALQPGNAGDAVELDLQLVLGNLLMQTEGFGSPATVASHTRAQELATRQGQADKCVLACGGIAASMWSNGRFDDVLGLVGRLAGDDPSRLRPMSRVLLAVLTSLAQLSLGALEAARSATDQALRELSAMPPEERQDINGVDPVVLMLTQSVTLSVHQGLLDRADADTRLVLQIAQARDHPPTRAWALSLARWMAFRHGDMDESIRLAQQVLELSERMGFKTRLGSGRVLMGRAVVAAGRVDEGAHLLREGFATCSAMGARTGTTELAAVAADALVEAGRFADAEAYVAAGEQALATIPERFFAAELARLRARLYEAAGELQAAEAGYRQALAIAQDQGAALFALRAATGLAGLLLAQGRPEQAHAILAPALEALPEGRDQRDARRAAVVLQAVAAASTAAA